ncbi:unnamed protein product [Prorocentrum cordatum]|uniref:RanBP2-type domain-containing protein n=1 Tax=Prorocentrum cordatum TaxID=2364126 RepID=A0ABN9S2A3_9DINO|nr:unnamed protein product [Polarella glacialis]
MAWSGGHGGAKDGDWYCPTCADLQFRNNPECRHCGLSKEQGVSEITPDMFLQGHDVRAEARACAWVGCAANNNDPIIRVMVSYACLQFGVPGRAQRSSFSA